MVIGSLWYGPLFGKMWMTAIGKTPDQLGMPAKAMVAAAVGALIEAFILAVFISGMGGKSWLDGATAGLFAAIGFVATSAYTTVSFEGRSLKVYLLGIGYQTVSLLVMGSLLGA